MTEVLTPSGLAIKYVEKPRRQYSLMVPDMEMAFRPVPSVTGVLKVLDKPLSWAAMRVGVAGVIDLIDRYDWRDAGIPDPLTTQEVTDMLTREKLTVNHVWGKAADRGKAAHKALEHFIAYGALPDQRKLPPTDRGFHKALAHFLADYTLEPIHSELLVGSSIYGFAGQFDLVADIDGETWLLDLKTSSKARVYDEALLQLAGYGQAYEESGYEPLPTRKAAVCVAPDGSYVLKESHCGPEHFLAVLKVWEALTEVKELHSARAAA